MILLLIGFRDGHGMTMIALCDGNVAWNDGCACARNVAK
jgi:hypothetical protein